jgi:hypothetical protein
MMISPEINLNGPGPLQGGVGPQPNQPNYPPRRRR